MASESSTSDGSPDPYGAQAVAGEGRGGRSGGGGGGESRLLVVGSGAGVGVGSAVGCWWQGVAAGMQWQMVVVLLNSGGGSWWWCDVVGCGGEVRLQGVGTGDEWWVRGSRGSRSVGCGVVQ